MPSDFVHLHVHSDFSMLDGACRLDALAARCRELEFDAIALTDHGNMCGAIEFYETMCKNDIKPIVGCEMYVAPGDRHDKTQTDPHYKGFHLVLLATDYLGYQNLCRLNAVAHLEGKYYKPRIDKESLATHHQGLIGCGACLSGEVATWALEGNLKRAHEAAAEYTDILGNGNFYLELQDHGLADQQRVNPLLIDVARDVGVPLIVTNDAHYLRREHAHAHEILLCIGTRKTMQDESRMRLGTDEFYLKSEAEMTALFPGQPAAMHNTREIAERCNLTLDLGGANHYPVYDPPDGIERTAYLRQLCMAALPDRYGFSAETANLDDEQRRILERIDYEVEIIERMGFVSYFLVVWDFLDFARREGIPVGPGRGSGAGSIVAYLLHITHIDPLAYNLLFERFLNPERVSPPDFDIDLCERRRGEVIDYVRRKYGADRVAQIGTFGTLKAKAVLKDVARVLGRSFKEGNDLTKMVPDGPKMTLEKAIEENPELRELQQRESWVDEVLVAAQPLEGLSRNMSIHAAGVIIGDQPLTNIVPLSLGANDEVITQYPAHPCEDLGLLKMDFLGLRTLTIIQDTCDLIEAGRQIHIEPNEISFDDEKTFDLLRDGRTVCVFQLESDGMQKLCRQFGVDKLEHVIALIALYRPGPLQFRDDFIDRKHGIRKVDYDVPAMREILQETFGIMLYQEQVMQVVQKVAGFTLGQADILRRAMGKKNLDVMAKEEENFMAGAKGQGLDEQTARSIWDKIVLFAGYGFNKSHSAAYAFLAYRTAWLKANYPVEFMAANLTNEMRSSDRVAELIRECREMGIPVLPPDVNTSAMQFSVDGDTIRFGLAAIKGVGEAAAQAILQARKAGRFTSMQDFCERVGSSVNRRLLESLVKCGAFDFAGLRRSQMFEIIEGVITRAQSAIRDREAGQVTFFDLLAGGEDTADILENNAPDIPEFEQRELLGYEKELLGFYVTGHPLAEYDGIIAEYAAQSVLDIRELAADHGVRLAGLVTSIQQRLSNRDQKPWALLTIEDRDGTCEAAAYSETFAEYQELIQPEAALMIEGIVRRRDGDPPMIMIERLIPLARVPTVLTCELQIKLLEDQVNPQTVEQLRELLLRHPGPTNVVLSCRCHGGEVAFVEAGRRYRVTYAEPLLIDLRRLLGDSCPRAKPERSLPQPKRRNNRFHRRQEAETQTA